MKRSPAPLAIISVLVLAIGAVIAVWSNAARAASPAPRASAAGAALITVVGTGTVPGALDLSALPQWVNVNIQTQDTDAQKALGAAQAKIAAIRTAAAKAGLPPAAVHVVGLNLSTYLGAKPYEKAPPSQPPGAVTQGPAYMAMATVQIDTVGVQQLEAAFALATAAGAGGVSAGYGKGAPAQSSPDVATLASAISDALAQARGYAGAAARATGRTLGAMHSVSIAPPMPDCCPPTNGWRVQVTVSYEIAPEPPGS